MESSQIETVAMETTKEIAPVSNKITEAFRKNVDLSSEIDVNHFVDKNDKEAIEIFRNLLESINKDPESLLSLPIIPIPEDMRKEFSQEENRDDQTLREFAKEADYSNHDYEKWLTDHNIEPAAIYTKVEADDIVLAAKFSDRLALAISRCGLGVETDIVKVSLKKALEKVREYSVAEYYADKIKVNALETISAIYPDLMTKNQLVIVPEPDFYTNGMYIGMYHNKHYIIINTSLGVNPYLLPDSKNRISTEFDESILTHEIIHARQHEILGNDPRLIDSFDNFINVNADNPYEVSQKLIDAVKDPKNLNTNTNQLLMQSVKEGEAIIGQLAICREKMLRTKNHDTQDALKYVQSQLRNILTFRDEDGKKYQCSLEMQLYRKGYDIIHPLLKEFGLQNLVSILSNTDMVKLANIPEGSSDEKMIITDPRLLPGLEKNAYISQSLKINPPRVIAN